MLTTLSITIIIIMFFLVIALEQCDKAARVEARNEEVIEKLEARVALLTAEGAILEAKIAELEAHNNNILAQVKTKLIGEYTDFEQDVLAIFRDVEKEGVTTLTGFKAFVREHARWYNDDLVWYIGSVL